MQLNKTIRHCEKWSDEAILYEGNGQMNIYKSLREVWEWKNIVYEKTKEMDKKETIQYFRKNVDKFLDEMGYKKIKIADGIYKLVKNDATISSL